MVIVITLLRFGMSTNNNYLRWNSSESFDGKLHIKPEFTHHKTFQKQPNKKEIGVNKELNLLFFF